MNIHEIILEDTQLNEKPTSSIGNFAKKVASKVTTGATSARLGGSSEVGSKANAIYKDLARWQGINGKNDRNMTSADLSAFMKQHKLSAGGMQLPDGVLPKSIIDKALKKAAASDLTGGNVGADSAPKAQSGGSAPSQGGVAGAMASMAKGAGVKAPQTKGQQAQAAGQPTTSEPAGSSPAPTSAPGAKVAPLKNKQGIPPEVQTMLDKLTPTEKKALAGAI